MGNDVKFATILIEDIGRCAYSIFKAGDKYKGQSVYISMVHMSFNDLAKICSEVTGKELR